MKQSYLNHNRMATVKEVDTAMQNDMNLLGHSIQTLFKRFVDPYLQK